MKNMELFNGRKNKKFECVENIINDIIDGNEYTRKDIIEIIRYYGFNEPDIELEKNILNENKNIKKNFNLLEKKEDKFYPVIDSKIPIRFSNIELCWLRIMVEDPRIKYHLNENLLNKLKSKLKKFDKECKTDFWIKKNIDNNVYLKNTDKTIKNLEVLQKAIKQNKFIKYTYVRKDGKRLENKVGFPFKIEYSVRNDKYWLIVLIEDKKYESSRMIKIIVSNLECIELYNNENSKVKDEILKFYDSKKNKVTPLVLEVEDINNALERCFFLFSHYDKESYYDKEKDKYIIKIYYYDFDEAEIIKDILSLGSCIIVIEPQNIRNKIIERIKKSIE